MQTNEQPLLAVWLWTSHLDSEVMIVRGWSRSLIQHLIQYLHAMRAAEETRANIPSVFTSSN